ncbi:hypothetical protein HAV22_11700 [Massilia sp. TW-1]|uniref:Uncharacterized protein n=1 Tax=Telluria antibiotica TaxID=2717319 RepID=A0ABX0PE12_9BURK|nr:hypothetical protein [Telluria antibiotica]NIA54295.1 hypothetical protein [Telluria antibiotica]
MDEKQRSELVQMGWAIHGAVESAYLSHPATRNVPAEWKEKQRLLLADMAIHLLQTVLKPGPIELDQLKNNLHSILTLSDQFLPHAELKAATRKLYDESPVAPVS